MANRLLAGMFILLTSAFLAAVALATAYRRKEHR